MVDKEWTGVTRSADEDLALLTTTGNFRRLTPLRLIVFLLMSATILGVYLYMNRNFFPGYPVVTTFAEKNELFAEHYPPFRMNEWTCYSITKDVISGNLYGINSFSRQHPIGFSLLSVPLTLQWGEAGPYFTNAIILWLSALFFFFLIMEFVPFYLAIFSTCILAFATPNIFFASSAFSEPAAQLFVVLALFFFMRGMSTRHEYYYVLAGFLAGINLFVQPVMAVVIIFFIIVMVFEYGRRAFQNWELYILIISFAAPLAGYIVINRMFLGNSFEFLLSNPYCPYNPASKMLYGTDRNIFVGIWKLIFDSPHGLLFFMPVLMLAPLGYIIMWRSEVKGLAIVSGCLAAAIIFFTAAHVCPVTGECVGSRHLVGIFPLLIIPLAFIWEEDIGEKIWLMITLALTVYMCTFGWWTGISRGKGVLIGVLQDRDARIILLARKGELDNHVFASTKDIEQRYFSSLGRGDIKAWLQTLDRDSIDEIHGFERAVFYDLVSKYRIPGMDRSHFIQSVDPDKGIRPVIPDLSLEISTTYDDIFPQ